MRPSSSPCVRRPTRGGRISPQGATRKSPTTTSTTSSTSSASGRLLGRSRQVDGGISPDPRRPSRHNLDPRMAPRTLRRGRPQAIGGADRHCHPGRRIAQRRRRTHTPPTTRRGRLLLAPLAQSGLRSRREGPPSAALPHLSTRWRNASDRQGPPRRHGTATTRRPAPNLGLVPPSRSRSVREERLSAGNHSAHRPKGWSHRQEPLTGSPWPGGACGRVVREGRSVWVLPVPHGGPLPGR